MTAIPCTLHRCTVYGREQHCQGRRVFHASLPTTKHMGCWYRWCQTQALLQPTQKELSEALGSQSAWKTVSTSIAETPVKQAFGYLPVQADLATNRGNVQPQARAHQHHNEMCSKRRSSTPAGQRTARSQRGCSGWRRCRRMPRTAAGEHTLPVDPINQLRSR